MANAKLVKADRILRWIHLYTGLFLLPWIMVYGASAFCLNHNQWFIKKLNITPPRWEVDREVDFTPDDNFPPEPAQQASTIVKFLDLDGPHRVLGKPNVNQMIINRICATGNYRITWRRGRSLLVVEKQKSFSFYRLIHFLHFSRWIRPAVLRLHRLGGDCRRGVGLDVAVGSLRCLPMVAKSPQAHAWSRLSGRRRGVVCGSCGSVLFVR